MIVLKAILLFIVFCILAFGVMSVQYLVLREKREKISFLESFNLTGFPILTFKSGEYKVNFLLDSGANGCSIDKSVLEYIPHKKADYHQRQHYVGGETKILEVCEIVFSYKDNEYKGTFLVGDYSEHFNAIKDTTGVTIHGIIGTDFFSSYNYVLDFAEMIAYSKNK